MAKWGYVIHIYCKDEEEKRRWKKIAERFGVSVSALVRSFFESLSSGDQIVPVKEGIIALLNLKIKEIDTLIDYALKSNNKLIMNNSLIQIRQALKQLIADLKNFSSK